MRGIVAYNGSPGGRPGAAYAPAAVDRMECGE